MSNHQGRNAFLPKEVLLDELRRVQQIAGDKPLTIARYTELGGRYGSTIIARCGTWSQAKAEAAGETAEVLPGEHKRLCLRCDRPFCSKGPHNRLCQACHTAISVEGAADERIYRIPYHERTRQKTLPGER